MTLTRSRDAEPEPSTHRKSHVTLNAEIRGIAAWARSQGYRVDDDAKGYTRFFDPAGSEESDHMATWSVTLTFPGVVAPEQLETWEDALGDDATVAAIPGRATTVAVWVEADDAAAAARSAANRVAEVVPHAAVAVEVADEATHLAAADAASVPELVSSVEAGELLGVSRQRVGQLARDHPRFPAPLYELRTGPLWTRDAIVWFATEVDRRPGRRAAPV